VTSLQHAPLWFPAYLRDRAKTFRRSPAKRLHVALTDHFEPMAGNAPVSTGLARLAPWRELWPRIAADAPVDSAGRAPVFTAFYPQEEYAPEILDVLADLGRDHTFDVEVHLHHDNDTASALEEKLHVFLAQLHEVHGLLHTHRGRLVFGFIHGNWALDNSRPDGRWCGVTGELQLLRSLGCYADFTMPSVPSLTQSRVINQIYWTSGDPARPRGFDHGIPVTPHSDPQEGLLMIPGPLGLRFRDRMLPRLEMGELACYDLPTRDRVRGWLQLAPRIGDTIFLKLYGHTAQKDNAAALLGSNGFPKLFEYIHQAAHAENLELNWSSAFDLFRAVEAFTSSSAEASLTACASSQS
jgi:hypothetical protein